MEAAHVHVRIDADTKAKAESILQELGLTPSQAVKLLYRQIISNRGIPFTVNLPNDETIATFKDTDKGRERHRYDSADAMLMDLKANA